jgi:hypothetical protein
LESADTLARGDIAAITTPKGLSQLDQFVYSPLPAWGRVALTAKRKGPPDLTFLLRAAALQKRLHEELEAHRITVISPSAGDPFLGDDHTCQEADIIWLTDDSFPHNSVAQVKRLGYRENDTVLRKAEVARYVRVGRDAHKATRADCPDPNIAVASEDVDKGTPKRLDDEADLLAVSLPSNT